MPFPIFRLGDQPEVVRDHTRGDKRTHFGHLADRPVRRTVSLLLYDLMAWASRIRGLWAEGLGSFEIDHQFKFDWHLNRQLSGVCTPEDTIDISSCPTKYIGIVRPVGEQTAVSGERSMKIDSRYFVSGRRQDDRFSVGD